MLRDRLARAREKSALRRRRGSALNSRGGGEKAEADLAQTEER